MAAAVAEAVEEEVEVVSGPVSVFLSLMGVPALGGESTPKK